MPGGPWSTIAPPSFESDRLSSEVTIGFRSTKRDVSTAARCSNAIVGSPSACVSWSTTSWAERGRSAGAVWRRRSMIAAADRGRPGASDAIGTARSVHWARIRWAVSVARCGGRPTIISNSRTPREKRSARRSISVPASCSGAM